MNAITVRCPNCTLEKSYAVGTVVPKDWLNDRGLIVCPNCDVPMKPIGETQVATAEQAFAEAQQTLAAADLAAPMPPAETVETLSKRLHTIEEAHGRVMAAEQRYESKHDAAKEAKKHLDNETASFLALTGRLSAVSTPLPLFTDEAEKAAAPGPGPGEVLYTGLFEQLTAAGYQAVTLRDLSAWTSEQRLEAKTWAAENPTEDALPPFMRELAEAIEAESTPHEEIVSTAAV